MQQYGHQLALGRGAQRGGRAEGAQPVGAAGEFAGADDGDVAQPGLQSQGELPVGSGEELGRAEFTGHLGDHLDGGRGAAAEQGRRDADGRLGALGGSGEQQEGLGDVPDRGQGGSKARSMTARSTRRAARSDPDGDLPSRALRR
ncbi:hypothetical protein GCM10020000_08430 [Streptomyces olivoverticillatus]